MDNTNLDTFKQELDETREIVERNHEMLEKIQSYLFWRRVFTIVYWIIIIGIAIGLLYFLQPYVDRVFDAYGQLQTQFESLPGLGES
jgi:hypothetical protein